MKKIVPLLVLLAVVVLAGCSFNTESGQGFMKFDKTKKAPLVTQCPTVAKTVYSYTTQTGASQSFEFRSFDELYNGIKTELQNNGGKPLCPYRFDFFQTGPDIERNDQLVCGNKDDLVIATSEDGGRFLSCNRQFGNVQVSTQIADLPDYGFLMDVFYNYGVNNRYGSAMEKVRTQGVRVERVDWGFL